MSDDPRPDLDERFSLDPLEGEEVLRELLRDGDPEPDADPVDCE